MLIRRMRILNFKTFRTAEIELDSFNVIIGSNAAGKSNFIQILRFLRDIAESGMKDAVSLQGGGEFIRPVGLTPPVPLTLELDLEFGEQPVTMAFCEDRDRTVEVMVPGARYTLQAAIQNGEIQITKEEIRATGEFLACENRRKECSLGPGSLLLTREKDGLPRQEIEPPAIAERIDVGTVVPHPLLPSSSILEDPVFFPPLSPLIFRVANFFRSLAVFDMDPSLAKHATLLTGKSTLAEDGSNLSLALKRILEDSQEKRKMLMLLTDLLPFVKDLRVERLGDRSLVTSLKETYAGKKMLPALLLSDGTMIMIALIIALYFDNRSPLIFEEPGRNIHPHLISRLIEMMKEVADRQQRQIIITTHHPEIVKYAGPEYVILLQRDKKGHSIFSRPQENEEIQAFLEEMGIEDLYVQDLLS